MKRTAYTILFLSLLLWTGLVHGADEPLDRTKYDVLEGLGTGICSGAYTTNPPLNLNDSSGEVGVSSLRLADRNLKMAGTIMPLFDPGLLDSSGNYLCERKQQVYSLTSRANRAIPGFSNTVIGLKIPSICAATGGTCQWSTQYAGPALSSGSAPDPSSEPLTIFPDSAVTSMEYVTQSSGNPVRTTYSIDLRGVARGEDDQITIVQHVYKPNDTPYFDVVWEVSTFRNTYNQVDFSFVVDTYTAGNDFGFGYICDVTHVIGGTGGTNFFQGFIGLQKPATLWEDWWAMLFYPLQERRLPGDRPDQPFGSERSGSPGTTGGQCGGLAVDGSDHRPGADLHSHALDFQRPDPPIHLRNHALFVRRFQRRRPFRCQFRARGNDEPSRQRADDFRHHIQPA